MSASLICCALTCICIRLHSVLIVVRTEDGRNFVGKTRCAQLCHLRRMTFASSSFQHTCAANLCRSLKERIRELCRVVRFPWGWRPARSSPEFLRLVAQDGTIADNPDQIRVFWKGIDLNCGWSLIGAVAIDNRRAPSRSVFSLHAILRIACFTLKLRQITAEALDCFRPPRPTREFAHVDRLPVRVCGAVSRHGPISTGCTIIKQ